MSPAREPEPGPAEERTLVARAQRGEVAAFEALYRRNIRRIYGLCVRLAHDQASADELAQETFVRAWRGLAGFQGEAAFASWLYRLAVNLALDDKRARGRAPWHTGADGDELVAGAPGRAANPDAGFDLERALRALPPRARAVFVLHDIEGHRHEEIAILMGIDAGTSKSQLHRARKLLREALSP